MAMISLLVAPLSLTPSFTSIARSPPWALDAACSLRTNGFAVLPDEASVRPKLVKAARAETNSRLELLLNAVGAAGLDAEEMHYSFTEICHRAPLRWDLRMPEESAPAFNDLCQEAFQQSTPALRQLTGCEAPRLVMSGAVVSRAGAKSQHVHTDGDDSGLFTIFIPLVDIPPESDGTSFLPGSHIESDVLVRAAMSEAGVMELDPATMAKMVSPACPAGGLLCFDYRTVHRGRANDGRERAVAYIVVATEEGVTDDVNFHTMSLLHDLRHPAMANHMAATVWHW